MLVRPAETCFLCGTRDLTRKCLKMLENGPEKSGKIIENGGAGCQFIAGFPFLNLRLTKRNIWQPAMNEWYCSTGTFDVLGFCGLCPPGIGVRGKVSLWLRNSSQGSPVRKKRLLLQKNSMN